MKNKKLQLNKETVAQLNNQFMDAIRGGGKFTDWPCLTQTNLKVVCDPPPPATNVTCGITCGETCIDC